MTGAVLVYVTVATMAEAQAIARAAVEDRLAACANILPPVHSVYHWDGKIEQAEEAMLFLKTRETLFPALETRIRELHSYKTPCITAVPVTAIHAPYLDWVMAETRP